MDSNVLKMTIEEVKEEMAKTGKSFDEIIGYVPKSPKGSIDEYVDFHNYLFG